MIGPERECWDAYAEALAGSTADDAFHQPHPSSAVWSSWYSWFEEITQRTIEDEIMPAARNGYDVIQIDDGWEKAVGWWEPNGDFPAGMASRPRGLHGPGVAGTPSAPEPHPHAALHEGAPNGGDPNSLGGRMLDRSLDRKSVV